MEARGVDARDLRRRAVRRFLEDFGSAGEEEKEVVREAIRHMYSPDLRAGWGIHIVQEEKLLAKKEERESLDSAIDELVLIGMRRCFLFFFSNSDLVSCFRTWKLMFVPQLQRNGCGVDL